MDEIGRPELIRGSLVAVVGEMRANVIHSSYSSIIRDERTDLALSADALAALGTQVGTSVEVRAGHAAPR